MENNKKSSQVAGTTSEDLKQKYDHQYLQSVLSNYDIERLKDAIELGQTIIIAGPQGPTGKTTLVKYLRERGVNVLEEHEVQTFTLNKFFL